ncbi:MAG: hypothetical protein J0G30_13525 [Actinomycetales bacterium]|nr:hypothetical protein [Actinomycetales bacterium]
MRVPDLLGPADLPAAELHAARLDGELFPLAEGFASIAGLDGPGLRAAAAAVGRSERLIADRRTAAWVWGVTARPPRPLEFCVDIRARTRPPRDPLVSVREVVLDEEDVVRFPGGGAVTTPLRTAVDLARTEGAEAQRAGTRGDDGGCAELLRGLGAFEAVTVAAAAALMDRRRNLSGKRAALAVLRAALGSESALSR